MFRQRPQSVAWSIVIVLSTLMCGCSSLRHQAIDHPFAGLDSAMQKPIVCVLFVHGMGGYANQDPQPIIDGIGRMPNMRATSKDHAVEFVDKYTIGALHRQDFVDTSNGHELRLYTLYWSPITYELKDQYLAYDQAADNTAHRLGAMNSLRASVLNGCIPDVVLYVGAYKAAIQHVVRQALRTMAVDVESRSNKEKDYEYFIVTWSLGSKIVFDCLADERAGQAAAPPSTDEFANTYQLNRIAEKTHSVFMLANQIPLLTLGDVKASEDAANQPTTQAYKDLLSVARRRKHATTQPLATTQPASDLLSIVAVSDPNDVLSYPIPPWLGSSQEAHFANVSISVARTAYYVPLVGWIVNPELAHTGYGADQRVIDLILHGSGKGNR